MPLIKRKSCRAIILNPANEILLIKIENPQGPWEGWITPGGGVDAGEDEITALQRELYEELGIKDLVVNAKIWVRFHSFPWKSDIVEQHEVFYLVNAKRFNPKPSLQPDTAEFNDLKEFRWWTIEEIQNSHEHFAPSRLFIHFQKLLNDGPPSTLIDVGI